MSDVQAKQFSEMYDLLQSLNARSLQFEQGQSKLLTSVNEIKKNQKVMQEQVTDINKRLQVVETKTILLETKQQEHGIAGQAADSLRNENIALRGRLDDMEDRSRRNNVIFYGIPDLASETWGDAERKITSLLSECSLPSISGTFGIERSHRLGAYAANKCRPIIVQFSSFKTRDLILSCKVQLKTVDVTVSEDFSFATRLARRKLIEFGKSQGSTFKLRFNKLYQNNNCYTYNPQEDRICVSTSFQRSERNVSVLPPISAPLSQPSGSA